jgi:hypothetical protein
MRLRAIRLVFTTMFVFGIVAAPTFGDDGATGRYDAVVEVTTSQGTRSLNATIEIVNPMSPEAALGLKDVLKSGGQQALANSIRNAARGRLLLGGVAFPLDLVVAERTDDGWRFVVVSNRNFRWDEIQVERPSLGFPFTAADFEVPDMGSGGGRLVPKAALSIGDDGRVSVDRFEGESGRLKDIRRR